MRTFVLVPISAAASGVAAHMMPLERRPLCPIDMFPTINRGAALPAVKPILDGTPRAATINACAIKLSSAPE